VSTPPQPPAGGKAPGGKLGNRRNLLIAAAVGTAAVAFVMARTGGSSGGGGGSDQVMLGYDSGPYDQYNDLQQQLEDLEDRIEDGVVTPGTPTTPKPTTPAPRPTPLPARPKPPVKPLPKPSNPAKRYVTIKRGDTLSGIAKRSGISMARLKKLNPTFWTNPKYRNGNMIWSGGKVRVK
jgi:nucleoid-associated protein YgaU